MPKAEGPRGEHDFRSRAEKRYDEFDAWLRDFIRKKIDFAPDGTHVYVDGTKDQLQAVHPDSIEQSIVLPMTRQLSGDDEADAYALRIQLEANDAEELSAIFFNSSIKIHTPTEKEAKKIAEKIKAKAEESNGSVTVEYTNFSAEEGNGTPSCYAEVTVIFGNEKKK